MKRLRLFFALALFLLFFPLWRTLDYQVMTLPSAGLFAASFLSLALFCIVTPLRLTFPKIPKTFLLLGWILLGYLSWLGSPLSGKATRHYDLRHCGASTYSGFFYHARFLFLPAHQDDFEVRNQMCWVRKMIRRAPEEISDVSELQNYLELLRKKLLSPPKKYKATLPLIALLHGNLSASLGGSVFESVEVGKLFVDSLHFWKDQYTVEISSLEYPWYAWPHSAYIAWEYGLVEKNWESIVDGIRVETN